MDSTPMINIDGIIQGNRGDSISKRIKDCIFDNHYKPIYGKSQNPNY